MTNKSPPGRPRSVCMEPNIVRVWTSVQQSPRRLARKHAIALHISDQRVRQFLLADLKFHPYKIQVVQFPSEHHTMVRLEFCHCIRELITEYPTFINNLVLSDEAHFHVNGSVNKQNM